MNASRRWHHDEVNEVNEVNEGRSLSKKIGDERVMASLTRFLADTLKLTVNVAKSAVARPWKRKFLGYPAD